MIFCLAEKSQAAQIAKIHKQEIREGFLSSLPAGFLEKLYLSIVENDFCVVAKDGGEVFGFIAGTADIRKLYNYFIKKYFFISVFYLLPEIFNIKKIIETLFYPQKEKKLPSAELLTVAVRKNFQCQGIAQKMFEVFISEMRKRNVGVFKVLVGERLKPAVNFYEKNGFEFLQETIVHKGQKSRTYIYHL